MKKFLFFFLDDFHQGTINHTLHFIGFTVLGYGLARLDLILILVSPLIMESGHVYNYLKGVHQNQALKILPIQFLGWLIFAVLGFLLFRFLNF